MTRWCRGVLLGAITIVSACGGSDSSSTTSPDPTTASAPPASVEPSSTPSTTPATNPAETSAPAPASELSDLAALDVIVVTNPQTGNGERPLLAWQPVDGATRYSLTLAEPDGAVYWAWTGASTSIWLGGQHDEPPADAAGPVLLDELVMRVVAVDASDTIIAASAPTPIAP